MKKHTHGKMLPTRKVFSKRLLHKRRIKRSYLLHANEKMGDEGRIDN
jgi:hypothetical protein